VARRSARCEEARGRSPSESRPRDAATPGWVRNAYVCGEGAHLRLLLITRHRPSPLSFTSTCVDALAHFHRFKKHGCRSVRSRCSLRRRRGPGQGAPLHRGALHRARAGRRDPDRAFPRPENLATQPVQGGAEGRPWWAEVAHSAETWCSRSVGDDRVRDGGERMPTELMRDCMGYVAPGLGGPANVAERAHACSHSSWKPAYAPLTHARRRRAPDAVDADMPPPTVEGALAPGVRGQAQTVQHALDPLFLTQSNLHSPHAPVELATRPSYGIRRGGGQLGPRRHTRIVVLINWAVSSESDNGGRIPRLARRWRGSASAGAFGHIRSIS
jgi:hypothetical protein